MLQMKGQNFLDSIDHRERIEYLLMDLKRKPFIEPKFLPWQKISCVVCLNVGDLKTLNEIFSDMGFVHHIQQGIDIFIKSMSVRVFLVNNSKAPHWNDLRNSIPKLEPIILMGSLGVSRNTFKASPALLNLQHAATLPDCDSRRWPCKYKPAYYLYCMVNRYVPFCEQRYISENVLHIRYYTSEPKFPVDMGIRINLGDYCIKHAIHPTIRASDRLCRDKHLIKSLENSESLFAKLILHMSKFSDV